MKSIWDWQPQANCLNADPKIFESKRGPIPKKLPYLKYCDSCVVKKDCLDFAIVNDLEHEIYGGLTPSQRRKISAKQKTLIKLQANRQGLKLLTVFQALGQLDSG